MHRRLAALAASLFLLNLNVIGVDRVCGPSHDVEQNGTQEHTGHGPQHAPPQQHEAPSKCCDAISSCGMTLSLGTEVDAPAAPHSHIAAPQSSRDSHSSVPRAPEPPPPRA